MVGINSFPASSHVRRPAMRPLENSQASSCIGWELCAGAVEKGKVLCFICFDLPTMHRQGLGSDQLHPDH